MYLSNYALWQGWGQFILPQVVPAWDPMKTDLLRICLFFIALNLVPHKKNNPNWLWIILCLSAFRAQQKPGGIFEPKSCFLHIWIFSTLVLCLQIVITVVSLTIIGIFPQNHHHCIALVSEIWHCCHVCPALLKVASSSGFRKALMIYQWWHRIIRIKALFRFALGLNFYTKASQIKVSKHW